MVHPIDGARVGFAETVAVDFDQVLRDLGVQPVERFLVFIDAVEIVLSRRGQRGIDLFEVFKRKAEHALGLLFDGGNRRHGGTEVLAADDVQKPSAFEFVLAADDKPRELDEKR